MSSPFKYPSSCEEGTWETNRWGEREDKWPEGFSKPRTCSFCGSAHPDDVIALMQQGWELEQSTKSYKAYLNPPGYKARMDAAMRDITQLVEDKLPIKHVNPVPPVKLYGNHLTPEQAAQINEMAKENELH